MNDDLKWLAENVSEWPDYAKSVYLGVVDGEPTEIFLSVPKKFVWEYDKEQWEAARAVVGDSIDSLEVTPEEEACWKEQDAKAYGKYYKDVSGLDKIDVYETHRLFGVTDHALCHASKKILMAGTRTGGKTFADDVREARDTLNRWLEMESKQ